VVISAIVSFGLQRFVTHPPIIAEIQGWQTDELQRGGTVEFLTLWAEKLPQAAELRVNLVEKQLPKLDRKEIDAKVVQSLNAWWTNHWPQGLPGSALLCGLGLVLGLVIVERLPIGDRWEEGKER
jgi:hypothetical protein